MDSKESNYGARNVIAVILIVLMFFSYVGGYSSDESAILYGLIDIIIITIIMTIIPLIIRIRKKQRFEYDFGVRVCLANSIGIFIISYIIYYYTNILFVGGLSVVMFYFINILFFSKPYSKITNNTKKEIEEKKQILKQAKEDLAKIDTNQVVEDFNNGIITFEQQQKLLDLEQELQEIVSTYPAIIKKLEKEESVANTKTITSTNKVRTNTANENEFEKDDDDD